MQSSSRFRYRLQWHGVFARFVRFCMFAVALYTLSSCAGTQETRQSGMRSDYFLEYNSFDKINYGEAGQQQGYSLRIFQDGLAYLILLENSNRYLNSPF
ncbi:MAG: hypothetical protein ACOC2C_00330, partial [Cyclonatronaceae bacterium]